MLINTVKLLLRIISIFVLCLSIIGIVVSIIKKERFFLVGSIIISLISIYNSFLAFVTLDSIL